MNIGGFDTDQGVLIVAEIGNNHEGSYALAEELVGRAAAAGAGAVKFQTFRTEHYVSRTDKARFERLKSFELTVQELAKLKAVADQQQVLFLSTPFDLGSVEMLEPLVAAFKISSGDNTFYPLLEAVAGTGKPVILSTGLTDLELIRCAVKLIERNWSERNVQQSLALLHCVSAYPVPAQEANLASITCLKREFGNTVGYSDHTLGIDACILAVALGARIVEKHFTLDKNQSDFRDHQLSADPAELQALVLRVGEVTTLLGSATKGVRSCESDALPTVRRSIVAAVDLQAGDQVRPDAITWVRPAGGLQPGQEDLVIGKVLRHPINAGERITLDDLRT